MYAFWPPPQPWPPRVPVTLTQVAGVYSRKPLLVESARSADLQSMATRPITASLRATSIKTYRHRCEVLRAKMREVEAADFDSAARDLEHAQRCLAVLEAGEEPRGERPR
jgi:hypothetical protein